MLILAIETAGIASKLVPAQEHSWGYQVDRCLDARLRDFETQRDASRETDPMFYQELRQRTPIACDLI